MSKAFDEIVRTKSSERKPIEKALWTLWGEIMGYEYMAIDAAEELAKLQELANCAKDWREKWCDEEDNQEAREGICDCEVCCLIRAVDSLRGVK